MDTTKSVSPKWTNTTKLIIGLSLLTIIAFLFSRFQTLLAPLLVTFILTYLMYSPAYWIMKRFHMNWRLSVTLLFVFLLLVILGLLTWGGLALVNQGQSLVAFLEKTIVDLPTIIDNFLHTPFAIGPFTVNFNQLNLTSLGNQIVSSIQPMLGNLGSFLGTLATGAASTIGWLLFIMLMSYFILSETEGKPERIFRVTIPGYEEDIRHMGVLLGRVWNAFLRGQFLIIAFVIAVYSILFGALGLRYFFGLAIIAGLARFLPYIGPFIAWTTYGLVAYFQGTTIFGFDPFIYAVFVVGVAWLTDIIIDNFVSTRVMADSLAVHPAAILVAALIGANLIGIAGMILAAPVLATLQLFFQYTMRKMFDLDPWEGVDLTNRKKQEVNLLPIIKQAWKKVKHRFNADNDRMKTGQPPHQKERDEK